MAFEVFKPKFPEKTFLLGRTLHLDKDDKVVEEDDENGVKVLGTEGKAFYEDEAKHYGLDDSHRLVAEAPAPVEEPAPVEAPAEPEPAPPDPTPEPAPEATPEPKAKSKKAKADEEAKP